MNDPQMTKRNEIKPLTVRLKEVKVEHYFLFMFSPPKNKLDQFKK
jgi:hypothetical protein